MFIIVKVNMFVSFRDENCAKLSPKTYAIMIFTPAHVTKNATVKRSSVLSLCVYAGCTKGYNKRFPLCRKIDLGERVRERENKKMLDKKQNRIGR